MVLVGALIIGNWTVLCVFNCFYFVNKDMFLTNLNTDLYHERGAPLKKKNYHKKKKKKNINHLEGREAYKPW